MKVFSKYKLLNIFIIATFIIYWFLTIASNFPNNPINIKYKKTFIDFNIIFNQKWSFFAPPNKSNTRLYYTFLDENKDVIKTFEVLKPIVEIKQEKAPFNTKIEIVDYIINGAINNLYGIIGAKSEKLKLTYPDSSSITLEKMAKDSIYKQAKNIQSFITLSNYAKIVAFKNLNTEQIKNTKYLNLKITEVQIPKFSNRNDSTKQEALMVNIELNYE